MSNGIRACDVWQENGPCRELGSRACGTRDPSCGKSSDPGSDRTLHTSVAIHGFGSGINHRRLLPLSRRVDPAQADPRHTIGLAMPSSAPARLALPQNARGAVRDANGSVLWAPMSYNEPCCIPSPHPAPPQPHHMSSHPTTHQTTTTPQHPTTHQTTTPHHTPPHPTCR